MDKKVLRAMYGPSLIEVALSAILSLAVGVVLAAAYLIFKPVSVVKAMPAADKQEEGMVYYMEGTKDPSRDRQLLRKEQLFLEGSSVVLSEDELNAWMASSSGAPKKPADANADPKAPKGPTPNELNFHILKENGKGVLQIGFPCTLDVLGLTQSVIVQMRGTFVKESDEFVYEPDTIYVGSLPAQRIPVLPQLLIKKIYAAQPPTDDLQAAWKKLANVAIEDNSLKLTMK